MFTLLQEIRVAFGTGFARGEYHSVYVTREHDGHLAIREITRFDTGTHHTSEPLRVGGGIRAVVRQAWRNAWQSFNVLGLAQAPRTIYLRTPKLATFDRANGGDVHALKVLHALGEIDSNQYGQALHNITEGLQA